MNEFIFGFSTGLSFILAIGAQKLVCNGAGHQKKSYFFSNDNMCNK